MVAKEQPDEVVDLKINWPTDDMPLPRFANLFVVQVLPTGEVAFTFGHISPFVVGTPQDQKEQAKALSKKGVEAGVVSRVVLTEPTARRMLRIMAAQLGEELPK